jgi:biopolymer transport protein ExbD
MTNEISNPFARRKRRSLDITPMIDVVFLILIFFMVTTSFVKKDLFQVFFPRVKKAQKQLIVREAVEIYINYKGAFLIKQEGDTLIPEDQLLARLKRYKDRAVVIKMDARSPGGSLIVLIGTLYQLGIDKFSIIVKEEKGGKKPPK